MAVDIDIKKLLEAGAHFGHKTSRWHPKMKPYIHSWRGGVHIIDLAQTVTALEKATAFLSEVAAKDRPVVALVGDGAFAMNGMEVHTAVENDIPVVWLVMNNGGHGMVHVGETLQFKGKFNTAQFNQRLDVAKIADAVGALSFVVDRAGDTEKALRQALASGRPCVIDVRTDPEAMPPTGIRLATLERFFQGRG
jgi:acetolactate synthase-1/2/3 large subunit